MTLEQLKMLKLVAEQGSLKSASEALYKTQPAISQGIKQLESQLGLQLFDRDGYRLVLTIEGEQIYSPAVQLLDKASESAKGGAKTYTTKGSTADAEKLHYIKARRPRLKKKNT